MKFGDITILKIGVVRCLKFQILNFYARQHIMYAIARICYRPSVCPSVRWMDQRQEAKLSLG